MAKATLNKKFKSYTGVLPPNDHRLYLTNRATAGNTIALKVAKKRRRRRAKKEQAKGVP